jgi:hypothetical protein
MRCESEGSAWRLLSQIRVRRVTDSRSQGNEPPDLIITKPNPEFSGRGAVFLLRREMPSQPGYDPPSRSFAG